jgi:catechol 2,3-dioxygenase-like lactoylglutathione lyase family enzyme
MSMEPVAVLKAVNLRVGNLETALGFYRDGLGLPVVHAIEGIAVLHLGSAHLVLDAQEDARTPGSGAVLHLWVGDVDAFHDALVDRGIRPESAPAERPWGDRDFVVVDPDGYRLTIVQAPAECREGPAA